VNARALSYGDSRAAFLRATVARFSPRSTHMHILWKDIRYEIRTLAANRAFALLAIVGGGLAWALRTE